MRLTLAPQKIQRDSPLWKFWRDLSRPLGGNAGQEGQSSSTPNGQEKQVTPELQYGPGNPEGQGNHPLYLCNSSRKSRAMIYRSQVGQAIPKLQKDNPPLKRDPPIPDVDDGL